MELEVAVTHPPAERPGELRPLLRLAFPLMLVNLGNRLMGTVDTILAGQISPLALGATGLGADIFFAGSCIGIGILAGLDPLVSQAFGAGRIRHGRRIVWQGFYLAILLAIPLCGAILGLALSLERFGIKADLAGEARVYIFNRMVSIVPLLVFVAGRVYLQAKQTTRPILVATVVSNIVNLVLAWMFLFGVPAIHLPALGVRGLAWAVSIATCFQVGVLAWSMRHIDPGPGSEPIRSVDRPMMGRIFLLGLPLGLQLLAELGIFVTAGIVIAGIDPTWLAAHQITLAVCSMTYMIPMAISSATSVRVGISIGRRDTPAARRSGIAGISLCAGFMLGCGGVMLAIPETLARIWTKDPAVLEQTVTLMRIGATFQIFDGIQSASSACLRGVGMTRFSLVANLVAYWMIALPVGWLFGFVLKGGPAGIWWGLTLGLAVAATTLTGIFLRVSRRPIAALENP